MCVYEKEREIEREKERRITDCICVFHFVKYHVSDLTLRPLSLICEPKHILLQDLWQLLMANLGVETGAGNKKKKIT